MTRLTALALLLGGLLFAASTPVAAQQAQATQQAVFAAGCFWCIEADFEKVDGVIEAVSGYAGGHTKNPTYRQVVGGNTGHKEVVRVTYDPAKVSYAQLLKVFWVNVDPYDARGQFCDKGESYKAAIFPVGAQQTALAKQSLALVETQILKRDVATTIEPAATFYKAETYHQNYYKTNSTKYKYYRWRCGRDARLQAVWGKADLTPLNQLTR
ncbi:MAG: peptide-methionine (S)-S-oxide reductase MsrA [Alphaproteobacteria bacterium]